MRIAYLGPAGTFSEDALRAAAPEVEFEWLPQTTIHGAILAVEKGEAERALVPLENSSEGSVRMTLDTLAFDAPNVTIAGEFDQPIIQALIARDAIELGAIEVLLSHPQATAQCAGFIRAELGHAEPRAATSTAEAVLAVAKSPQPWAALAAPAAAAIYGCTVIREGVEDDPGNVTRFVWLAPAGTELTGKGPWKTTISFSELGDDHPGALVDALGEFASREVNLVRIESRPLRPAELGRYMFFADLEGSTADASVAAAIEGLRGMAENVRIHGSYPVTSDGVPGLRS